MSSAENFTQSAKGQFKHHSCHVLNHINKLCTLMRKAVFMALLRMKVSIFHCSQVKMESVGGSFNLSVLNQLVVTIFRF